MMYMPIQIRILSVLVGLVFLLVNVWRPLFGFSFLTGPYLWACFTAGVIAILAGLYGGAGYYENQKVDHN